MKKINLFSICLSLGLQAMTVSLAQSGSVASGGEASGSGGSASFSIGQIDFTSASGIGGNLEQGLQQPYDMGGGPLPVTLLTFTVQANAKNQVDIHWSTATETNNAYFMVERSKDAVQFEGVVKVDGNGNSASILQYYALDKSPYNGKSYYRLKQVDFGGQFKYSKIVPVQINDNRKQIQLMAYPNPTSDVVTVSIKNADIQNMSCGVYDMSGKPLILQKVNSEQISFSLKGLTNATYLIKILDGKKEIQSFKIMKNK